MGRGIRLWCAQSILFSLQSKAMELGSIFTSAELLMKSADQELFIDFHVYKMQAKQQIHEEK